LQGKLLLAAHAAVDRSYPRFDIAGPNANARPNAASDWA
jgi:hypothetical protein